MALLESFEMYLTRCFRETEKGGALSLRGGCSVCSGSDAADECRRAMRKINVRAVE
jgi:hypothetical protein